MKLLISLFVMICAIQANAVVYDYGLEMVRPDGCKFRWPLHEQGAPNPEGVAWYGSCVGNKAQGYGLIFELNSPTSYFIRYSSGNAYPMLMEIKNGVAKPVFLNASHVGVTPDYNPCSKYKKECDQLVQMYNEMKSSLPKNPYAGKSDKNSSKKSGPSSEVPRGNVMAKPAGFVTDEGPYIGTCDDQRLAAEIERYGQKVIAQYGREASICPSSKGMVKVHYFAITLLQKNCPGDSRAVEAIEQYTRIMNEALETISQTCVD
ncbi:hypothetical protein ACLVWU_13045 [Bdellovibrio sp. HCB290]|uniref:hypothetical protein n=1 Tax=Bdellovibrio sp. HCB290 TaxID=3394356 RepID=UPI0039B4FEEB